MRASRFMPWIVLLALAAFPLVASQADLGFYVSFVRRVMIFALAAASLNFILGYGGMVALGHAAFFGAGAYCVAIMATEGISSALVAWPVALLVVAALALIIGAVSLRTHGVYFILITLAFAQMVYYIFISLRKYGGDDGLNLTGHSQIPGLDLANDRTFYYVVLAILAGCLSLLNRMIDSRFGQALQGIRENETRMLALGYPVFAIKMLAFVIAGVMAGLAGVLLANHNLFVSPAMMHWTESASLIIMVIVGGIGHRWGGAVGAAVMLTLEEFLRLYTDYWHLPLGLLLLAIVLLAPAGLAGAWRPNAAAPARSEQDS